MASKLKIDTVIVHTLRGLNPGISQIGLMRMHELVTLASEKQVHIALENIRKHEYNDYLLQTSVVLGCVLF